MDICKGKSARVSVIFIMPLAVEYSQVQHVFKDLLEEAASALPAAVEKRLQLAMIYGRQCVS